jgi:6-phosphogluconolactonase (cycloisomerase 2 family)
LRLWRIVCAAAGLLIVGCGGTRSALPTLPIPPSGQSTAFHDASPASSDVAKHKVYVANSSANSITEYKRSANGDIAPIATIAGSATGLSLPSYIALDPSHHLFVTNATANSVTEYAKITSGNTPPIATIQGAFTQLSFPQGIALDASGRIYVANGASTPYITVYRAGANGNIAPSQTIYDATGFLSVAGLAVHGTTIYISNTDFNFSTQVSEYPTNANGIVTASAQIGGLTAPLGVAVEGNGKIVVADGAAIKVFAANANGFPTPLQTIAGSNTLLNGPAGVAVGSSGIFVADGGTPAVTSYSVGANGDIAPLHDITGNMTMLAAPVGVAIK